MWKLQSARQSFLDTARLRIHSLQSNHLRRIRLYNSSCLQSSVPVCLFLPWTVHDSARNFHTIASIGTKRSLSSSVPKNVLDHEKNAKSNSNSTATTKRPSSIEDALSTLPEGSQIHLDFYGEPVTFLGAGRPSSSNNNNHNVTTQAMAALDGFILGVTSKGKACQGGGEEYGLQIQAAHSTAISWSELIRHATIWNPTMASSTTTSNTTATSNTTTSTTTETQEDVTKAAPMLAYVAVAPIIAQTGVPYLRYVDTLLQQVPSGVPGIPSIQLLSLAHIAASYQHHPHFNPREQAHLQALGCLLSHDYKRAMMILLRLLQCCPGDVLALSMVLDIAHTIGDPEAALRYVEERKEDNNQQRPPKNGKSHPIFPIFLYPFCFSCCVRKCFILFSFLWVGRFEDVVRLGQSQPTGMNDEVD